MGSDSCLVDCLWLSDSLLADTRGQGRHDKRSAGSAATSRADLHCPSCQVVTAGGCGGWGRPDDQSVSRVAYVITVWLFDGAK